MFLEVSKYIWKMISKLPVKSVEAVSLERNKSSYWLYLVADRAVIKKVYIYFSCIFQKIVI